MPDLSIMIKPASSICNLKCKYCFYHSLSEERKDYSFGKMDFNTADALIEKALFFANGCSIYFAFQGGEPLFIGLDYFKHFVEKVTQLNIKNSTIYYSLQTNGTLITEEFAQFFHDNDFLIGLSLDGNQDANRFRVDKDYAPVFNKVLNATKILTTFDVKFNILIVATGYTADHIEEVYNYLKEQGFKYLQFIPCLRPFNSVEESNLYMTEEQFYSYMVRLFNLYVKDYVRGNYISVRHLDNIVNQYLGNKVEQCGITGHCYHQFVIEGNGNVYPCDFYCLDEYLLGNILTNDLESLANSQKANDFIKESFNYPSECKTCKWFFMCRAGGCKRQRQDRSYCEAYKKFYNACYPLFRVFNQK